MAGKRSVTLLVLALGSTAAVAWGLSSQRVLRAAMPDRGSRAVRDTVTATVDGPYCPLPAKATLADAATTSTSDTLSLFGGQSSEPIRDSAQQQACPGVPLPK